MDYVIEEKTEEYWKKKNRKTPKIILSLILQIILGFPKTLVFNIYYFGIEGFKLPVLLSCKVKLSKMKGKVIIQSAYRTGMIKLGFTASETFDNNKLSFVWINDGIIIFKSKASMHNGTAIKNYGVLIFGCRFHIPATATIICYKKIEFGDDVLVGWGFEIMDGDAHKLYDKDDSIKRLNPDKEIRIGNKVWFGANVNVLKGVETGDNMIVAAGTTLTKSVLENNCVVGGNPVQILRKNIIWEI